MPAAALGQLINYEKIFFSSPSSNPLEKKMKGSKLSSDSLLLEDTSTNQFLNSALLIQQLPRQSPRWSQLTNALLSLMTSDTQRQHLDLSSLSGFLEVIYWRAHGKITAEEFSILYTEWMQSETTTTTTTASTTTGSAGGGGGNSTVNNRVSKKKVSHVTVNSLRSILLEKKYTESDLDLFIGILCHEVNQRLLNTTLSYHNKRPSSSSSSSSFLGEGPRLMIVTEKWLTLSEEVFFLLDSAGYGSLSFDECYTWSACLVIGLQSWSNERELEADLALLSLSAMAMQFMIDCGSGQKKPATATVVSSPSQEITMPMFKRYLIKKNLSEDDLLLLLHLLRQVIDLVGKLARRTGAEELYTSCQPFEFRGTVLGSPRLWQEAVLRAADLPTPPNSALTTNLAGSNGSGGGSSSGGIRLPQVVVYLLAEGQRILSLRLRASESQPVDREDLEDNANRLYLAYRRWAQEGKVMTAGAVSSGAGNGGRGSEIEGDPVYQLFLSVILHYKHLQNLLLAALYDVSLALFGPCPSSSASHLTGDITSSLGTANGGDRSLAILCANILPNNRRVLMELGVEEEVIVGQEEEEEEEVESLPLQMEDLFGPPSSSTHSLTTSSAAQRRSSLAVTTPMEIADLRVARSSSSARQEDSSSASSSSSARRISNLPIAAKRRSSVAVGYDTNLINPPQPPPPAPLSTTVTVMTSGGSQKSVMADIFPPAAPSAAAGESKKNVRASSTSRAGGGAAVQPNYVKPTSLSLARSSSRSHLRTKEQEEVGKEQVVRNRTGGTGLDGVGMAGGAVVTPAAASSSGEGAMMATQKEKTKARASPFSQSSPIIPSSSSFSSNASPEAEWKSILDRRSLTQGLKESTNSTIPDRRKEQQDNLSQLNNEMEEEDKVIEQLLMTKDPAQQTDLLEKLRKIRMQRSSPSSNSATADINTKNHNERSGSAPPRNLSSKKSAAVDEVPSPPYSATMLDKNKMNRMMSSGSGGVNGGDNQSVFSDGASSASTSIPSTVRPFEFLLL
eukprot:scaffold446_cov183-Ochromonas_danica.AAC.12